MASCVCGVVLLAFCWSLVASQSLKIKVVNEEGVVQKDFSDSSAAFQDRSYLLPAKESDAIQGYLVYPVPRNACSTVVPVHPDRNDTYIAYLEEFQTCPGVSEGNLQSAGYSAIIAYSSSNTAYLNGRVVIPQALILDRVFASYLVDVVIPGTNESSDLMVKIWDDSFAKLEQLFIIFGAILLVAVFLSVCVFCSSLCCRVALVRWRTRGLTSWQIRSLPKRKYRKAKEMTDTCSICLDEFKEGETVRVLPCDHVFHPKCVDEWLKKWNRTCPLCKSTIKRHGGRTQNPPAQTDENESSLLLPSSRAASLGREDRTDGDYGATAVAAQSQRGHGQQHRRGGSGSSSGSAAGQRNQVTSAEIELSGESNLGRLSSPLSLYHTPLHSDDDEQTPSYATANSGRASASYHSVATQQV